MDGDGDGDDFVVDDDGDTDGDGDVDAASTVAIICATGPVATFAVVLVCDDPIATVAFVHDGASDGDGVGDGTVATASAAPNVE